jgi:hypothetical protein
MEFKEGEAMAIGQATYEKIRDEMEENYWGRMVVIDVKSGDYEIGGAGEDDFTVTTRLLQRRPDAYTWGELVGYPAPYSFVGPLKPLPRRAKNVG